MMAWGSPAMRSMNWVLRATAAGSCSGVGERQAAEIASALPAVEAACPPCRTLHLCCAPLAVWRRGPCTAPTVSSVLRSSRVCSFSAWMDSSLTVTMTCTCGGGREASGRAVCVRVTSPLAAAETALQVLACAAGKHTCCCTRATGAG